MITIPKIIHCCWFGDGQMSSVSKYCMKSWDKLGYEIRIWDNNNIEYNDYLERCRRYNKWCNMSNYIRLSSLEKYGGIYLDVDVEVIKPFDSILENQMFLSWESSSWVNHAVFGSIQAHPFLRKCIQSFSYEGNERCNESGPRFLTPMLQKEYKIVLDGTMQKFDDLTIYTVDYLYPQKAGRTKNTITVHKFEQNWK